MNPGYQPILPKFLENRAEYAKKVKEVVKINKI